MPQVSTVTPDGDAIRARRERRGLSRAQLGKMTGRNPETIRNIERGHRVASVVLINQVANALGVEPEDLIKSEPAA